MSTTLTLMLRLISLPEKRVLREKRGRLPTAGNLPRAETTT
jgi:hypothetical protein